MSDPWAHIARCIDLRDEDVAKAIATRQSTRDLLARLAAVSSPNTGVAKALLVLARMATTGCDWIDGDLRIELTATGAATVVDVSTDLGGGLFERALHPLTYEAPLEEFTRAIDRVPRMVAPLVIRARTERRLILSATAAIRRTSAPPPPIEISAENLYVRAPAPAPPPQALEAEPGPLPVVSSHPRPLTEPPVGEVDKGWDD